MVSSAGLYLCHPTKRFACGPVPICRIVFVNHIFLFLRSAFLTALIFNFNIVADNFVALA